MICEALSDRMPAVARGEARWDAEEGSHLAGCTACQEELALITDVLRFARPTPRLDLDRLTAEIVAASRSDGKVVALATRRRNWGRALVGLAAAAGIALVAYGLPESAPTPAVSTVPARATTAIPELDALLEEELKVVLASLTDDGSTPTLGPIPRLGELTEDELDALLADVEG